MWGKRLGVATILLAGALLAGIAEAANELVVVRSNQNGLAPGDLVQRGQKLELPGGAEITLVAADGSVMTLKGPFSGQVPAATAGQDAGLIATLSSLAKEQSKQQVLGAVRGGPAPSNGVFVIDGSRAGKQCVARGAAAEVRRAAASAPDTGTIREAKSNAEGELVWQSGQRIAAWPANVPLVDGGDYLVRAGSRATPQRIEIRLMPADLPNDAQKIRWLADAGCSAQAGKLLEGLR